MAAQTNKKKTDDEIVQANPVGPKVPTDELEAVTEGGQERLFEELTQRADAVDKVLMEKGDPELDLTSG